LKKEDEIRIKTPILEKLPEEETPIRERMKKYDII